MIMVIEGNMKHIISTLTRSRENKMSGRDRMEFHLQVDIYPLKRQSKPSTDPEGGTGGPEPPWKITSYTGFYRK